MFLGALSFLCGKGGIISNKIWELAIISFVLLFVPS